MNRNLKTLGLALVAALALSAVAASGASAAPALFTAEVGANEQAEIHGAQVGTDTFTIEGLPAMTCVTAKETGFPEEGGNPKLGPEATYVKLTPVYETCHLVIGGFLTRTLTITTNGCTYTFNATKNTSNTPFSADLTVNCPLGQQIEIHIYNTSNHDDSAAGDPICTYDVQHQTINNQVQLTNSEGTPDHILAHINAMVAVHNTILSATCGNNTNPTLSYSGTHTLQATNEAGQFVNTTVS